MLTMSLFTVGGILILLVLTVAYYLTVFTYTSYMSRSDSHKEVLSKHNRLQEGSTC